MFKVNARVIAFSPSFKGKDGAEVLYPKLTVRVEQQIVEMPVEKGVDVSKFVELYVDKDVALECEVYPSKTKSASLRVLAISAVKQ